MAIQESSLAVGTTGEELRTFQQDTIAGTVHTEAVALVDADDTSKILGLHTTAPPSDAIAVPVRAIGELAISATALPLPNGAATAAQQLPDNHQVSVSNQPAEFPLPAAQVATLTKQTGTWGYKAGVSGSPTIPVGARVLQISAATGALAASFTINSGDAVTIPANQALTVEPKGNLVAPTVAFSGTSSYFVEYVS